jgi:diguanylate cyclase (GGDEF)-like protein/PAS domain S-box-containing protein
MKAFRDWSIRHKLTGLFMAMACISTVAISLPLGIFDFWGTRTTMVRDLEILTDVLARNSTAAITFRDADAARDVLQALRAEPSITAACVYTEDGEPFARYVRQGKDSGFVPPPAQAQTTRFERDRLVRFRRIVLSGETVGTIYIESDLQRLDRRFREEQLVFLAALLVTMSLAFFLASRFQRPISRPLVNLVQTAKAVSIAADYSVRADVQNRDEFGLLVSAFNEMLDQIERRDQELRQYREHLEEQVTSRTAELSQAEEKYRAIFEDAVVGIFQITPEGRPLSINRALAQMYGYDSPEQFLAGVPNMVDQLFVNRERMKELKRRLDAEGVVRSAELEAYDKDRTKKWVLVNLRAVRGADGNILLYEGTVEDVTDRKVAEERVQFLAYYDALTGLHNRTFLRQVLAKALASTRRQDQKTAVLFLDLDRFKIINDSLGHSFGDLLLQQVAERLKRCVREEDTVARVGGDEFLIVLAALESVTEATIAADRILNGIAAEFLIEDQRLNVTCSIGVSIFPEHGMDGETLIKNADAAMYCAKEKGRNTFQFFTEDMNIQVVERLTLENSLRLALERKELFLVYQPQMEIASGMIVGVEALLRWQHPERGLVPPDKFIRVAESSGLIMPIGEWVLREACSQVREWQDAGLLVVPVAVNVSAVQFRQGDFLTVIKKILSETGLSPEYLELELTESTLLSNVNVIFPMLEELRTMGLKLAIDDFGTGYSSLSYLRQFPVSKLKIDRSFVQDVVLNSDDAAITAAIISMAKGLNLKVIAEGVETGAQMAFLRVHQCDQIQGYYFSRPLMADKVAEKLAEQFGSHFVFNPRELNGRAQKPTHAGAL